MISNAAGGPFDDWAGDGRHGLYFSTNSLTAGGHPHDGSTARSSLRT